MGRTETTQGQETAGSTGQQDDVAQDVLHILEELSEELRPGRGPVEITLQSALERDLGIDSLARTELLARLERAFQTSVSEQAVMQAEVPADLVAAILMAGPRAGAPAAERETIAPASSTWAEPSAAGTIPEAVAFHLSRHPDRLHMRLLLDTGDWHAITYAELWRGAQAVAAGVRELLVTQGQTVAIMLPTSTMFFEAFLGTLLAGAVPVPIYPPTRRPQIGEHLLRQAGILRNAQARLLIATPDARPFARLLKAQVETIAEVVTVEDLGRTGEPELWPSARAESTALLQYTSGSTGDPKGVILTHRNLLANIRAIGRAFDVRSDDVVVSWLPLYHDMGLIGAWMGCLYYGLPVVVMSPLKFLARPERWLWAIHRFRGTISAAPNFAYELCATRPADDVLEGLDLSSWRAAGNGAEAVQAATVDRFAGRYAPYGFRRNAMMPMYGLAENAVAVTTTPVGRGPQTQRVNRQRLVSDGRIEPAEPDDPKAMVFVGSGMPVEGHELRIVGPAGGEAGERQEGLIQFRGPSATQGYFRNPDKTAELFDDGWVNTGDTGFVDRGELFVTGRIKDLIVRAGRNIYPEEIETSVGRLAGVRAGRVAVFASPDPDTGTDRLVVVAETRYADAGRRRRLATEISDRVTAIADLPPEDVLVAEPGTVLKTANGKLRRAACQALYEAGTLGRRPAALWLQIANLVRASILPELRRWRRAVGATAYAVYFQTVYRSIGPAVWIALMVTPGVRRRRRLFRAAARLALRMLGLPVAVEGLEHVPAGRAYVLAANHASYLDGLVVAAAVPGDYAFTAKRELRDELVAGRFLDRLGAVFVERVDPAEGVEDVGHLANLLGEGQSLVVFPEGTFDRRPGLRSFHMGAFVIAAQGNAPVLPAAIRGTRSVLRGDSWFARRGRIAVTFGEPIEPTGRDWHAAVVLRDRVRSAILRDCGEPDLAFEPTALALRGAGLRRAATNSRP